MSRDLSSYISFMIRKTNPVRAMMFIENRHLSLIWVHFKKVGNMRRNA